MQAFGRLFEVFPRYYGSGVVEEYVAGSTVLHVDSASDFSNQDAPALELDDEVYNILSIVETPEYDIVTVDHGLLRDVSAGEFLSVYPSSQTLMGKVLQDVTGKMVEAVLDQASRLSLDVGTRLDEATQERVVMDDTLGRWRITDVLDQPPSLSSEIPLPLPDEPTEAPADAPVPVAEPAAVGGVQATWDAIENATRYEVAASLDTPVPEDGSAPTTVVTSLTRGQVYGVGGAPLTTAATVYMKVRAVNDIGAGPWSVEVSAEPRMADAMITAAFIASLEIEAQQIISGTISSDLGILSRLLLGGYVVFDGLESSITIYADLDHTVPLVQLRPEGSVFRGRVIADDISVLQGLILLGTESQITAGAGVTMMSGVADPTAPPTLSVGLESSSWPAVPSGFKDRGVTWDSVSNQWLRLLVSTDSDITGKCKVQRISASTGAVTSTVTLGNISGLGEDDMNSIVRIGSLYIVMVLDTYYGNYWSPIKFNASTGAFVENAGPHLAWSTSNRPVAADYNGDVAMPCITDAGLGIAVWELTDWSGDGYSFQYYPIGRDVDSDPQDYYLEWEPAWGKDLHSAVFSDGNSKLTVGAGANAIVYDLTPAIAEPDLNSTYNADKSFSLQSSGGGVAYRSDATPGWYSEHGGTSLYKYSDYLPAAGEMLYSSYVDSDGTHVTLPSPMSSLAIPTRRYARVSLPPAPSGVTQSTVYTKMATSAPTISDLRDRSETLTAERTMLVNPAVAPGASAPPAASTFPGGSPGWFKSALGGIAFYGNGVAKVARTPTEDDDVANKLFVGGARVALTLNTGYVRHDFGSDPAYTVIGGRYVVLSGIVKKTPAANFGTSFETVAQLPAGLFPNTGNTDNQQFFMIGGTSATVYGRARVKDNGEVAIQASAAASYLVLDGIRIDLLAYRAP